MYFKENPVNSHTHTFISKFNKGKAKNWIWISADTTIHNLQKSNKSVANCKPDMSDTHVSITNRFVLLPNTWASTASTHVADHEINKRFSSSLVYQTTAKGLKEKTYILASTSRFNSWWLFQKDKAAETTWVQNPISITQKSNSRKWCLLGHKWWKEQQVVLL